MVRAMGKMLEIDLTKEKIVEKRLEKDLVSKFIGSRGINAKILFDNVSPETDPLTPENYLILGAGTFVGTMIPTTGQLTITSKSPETGLYLKTNTGGHFAAGLRFAGYNIIVIHGKSKSPVSIIMEDNDVKIKKTPELWGKTIRETNNILKKDLGDFEIAAIGPAGENLVKYANIMVSVYHAAGRGGAGAVMGSKNLKAIAVRGSEEVEVDDPETVKRISLEAIEKIKDKVKAKVYLDYGTAATLTYTNESWSLPTKNFIEAHFGKCDILDGHYLVEKGYMTKGGACTACPIGCHKFSSVKNGRYRGFSGGPEYETLAAFGPGCYIENTEAVLKANELCNDLGLDSISTGGTIQWALESYERGALKEEHIKNLNMKWGNEDTVIELIEDIAYRRDLGDLLAEGTKKASEKIGRDSWKWAVQARGLEQSRVDTRSAKAYALTFAVNPRGPDHLHAQPMAEFGFFPESLELVEQLTGDKKYANPIKTEKKPEISRWHEDIFTVSDSLGVCSFATTTTYILDPQVIADLFTAVTGIQTSEEEIMKAGRRILTLERCFNIREGLTKKEDRLPWRLMNEPVPHGPNKGLQNSPEELEMMLNRYYELMGYDKENAFPTKKTLKYLQLEDVEKELIERGIPLK